MGAFSAYGKRHTLGLGVLISVGLLGLASRAALSAEQPVGQVIGEVIYGQRCAACHDNATGRTPARAVLRDLPPESIVTALTNGAMIFQASGLTRDEIGAVAEYLSDKSFGSPQAVQTRANPCARPPAPVQLDRLRPSELWNGWGRDLDNSRYQPAPGLKAGDVPRLKVKWAYAYAGRFAYGQPTIIGDRLFVTNSLGEIRSLDANTGCEHWMFKANTSAKVAISLAAVRTGDAKHTAAFFGDERATVYAVDADTGVLLWSSVVDTHAVARIVGAPVHYEGRLYVPVSAAEEAAARDSSYPCCTFRGSMVALDAATGELLWKSHAIQPAPRPIRTSTAGTQMHGPAGGAIWSAPTIDARRGLLYVGTGNSYTDVDTDGADAIVAFDLKNGERRWVNQLTRGDNFVIGCPREKAGEGNCPDNGGPDFDFGASPILRTLPNGRRILLAGQKSGIVYGLDPDENGKLLWRARVGSGSALGGVEWGMAADDTYVYAANSDAGVREGALPGLTSLRIADGEQHWHVPTPAVFCSWGEESCRRGQPGAVTLIPGVVFSGALDGHMRAYDANTGAILWDFDTSKAIATINGPLTEGGGIDAGGATIANGVLYVNSGYGRWGKPGRLLLAFTVDGK
ncbi:MAG: PQQ-binding-like beta-propeller repeat protein [Steroidobacter sp.]